MELREGRDLTNGDKHQCICRYRLQMIAVGETGAIDELMDEIAPMCMRVRLNMN